jgi:hypothetical protein
MHPESTASAFRSRCDFGLCPAPATRVVTTRSPIGCRIEVLCDSHAARCAQLAPILVVVGRPDNVRVTHAMYDGIVAQLERFALEEWTAFNREQRAAVGAAAGVPWCQACEAWTATYHEHGRLWCDRCDARVLPERPLIQGFSWKTGFYRGVILRTQAACTSSAKPSSSRGRHARRLQRWGRRTARV